MDRVEDLVRETPDYRLSLEPYEHYHFVHNDVHRWSPAVLRDIRNTLDIWEVYFDLRVFVIPDNAKLLRYAKLFGFTFSHTMVRPRDGQPCHILTRRH